MQSNVPEKKNDCLKISTSMQKFQWKKLDFNAVDF